MDFSNINKIGVIADQNVMLLYPYYLDTIKGDKPCYIFSVLPGERNKSITEATYLWQNLMENQFDKNSLIINFGGGMISDLGGFVASTFKRGIPFINVPTTLLAMIDAAAGGKNGVNLNLAKNMVGSFCLPQDVIIDTLFIKTLSPYELYNGFGELIKYALIGIPHIWNEIKDIRHVNHRNIKKEWIDNCVAFKTQIVQQDFYDRGPRHILNFGHTIGHAIESCSMDSSRPLSHGHAVALGMVAEAYLSHRRKLLSAEDYDSIRHHILHLFSKIDNKNTGTDFKEKILSFCYLDKKNTNHQINVTMLKGIGQALPDQVITAEECLDALQQIL